MFERSEFPYFPVSRLFLSRDSSCFDKDAAAADFHNRHYLSLPYFAMPSMAVYRGNRMHSKPTSAPGVCGKTFASEAVRRTCKVRWKD